jgi:hypothetical protein
MSSALKKVQKQAQSKIESSWKDVAKNYTVAWMGPIEVVEMHFPFVSSNISSIRNQISSFLPIIIYQTRESPPENMSVAVPYAGGDGYKCRLVATNQLSSEQMNLLGEFAQAIWFLIDSGAFPHPGEGKAFENRLIELTAERLIKL